MVDLVIIDKFFRIDEWVQYFLCASFKYDFFLGSLGELSGFLLNCQWAVGGGQLSRTKWEFSRIPLRVATDSAGVQFGRKGRLAVCGPDACQCAQM